MDTLSNDSTRIPIVAGVPIAALIAVFSAVLLLLPVGAGAIPRYSARYQQNCILCHVNPTGGGQRTSYAVQFLVPTEISGKKYSPEEAAKIDPQLGKNLSVGLDFRTIHHYANRKDIGYDNFTLMQGSIYLTYQLSDRFQVALNRGVTTTTSEIFGLAYVLPLNGDLKVGYFFPAFGWRWDDHTMFTRLTPLKPSNDLTSLASSPPPGRDVGIEASIYPGRLMLTGSVTNGNLGTTQDNNRSPAYTASGLYRLHVAGLGIGAGGSFWHNEEVYTTQTGLSGTHRRMAGGPYGYLKWKPVTWVGEADWSKGFSNLQGQPPGSPPEELTHFTLSQELAVELVRGFELRGTYDFHDPDIHRKNGARARYGAGFSYMPYPFLSFQLMVNAHHFIKGKDINNIPVMGDYTQSETQIVFFY